MRLRRRLLLLSPAILLGCVASAPSSPPALTSASPATTVLGESTPTPSPLTGALYRCDTFPFVPAALAQPGMAERDPDAAADALRDFLTGPTNDGRLPSAGWRRLGSDVRLAEFANFAEHPAWNGFVSITFEARGPGWQFFRLGGCQPRRVVADGLVSLVWWLPDGQPDPNDATLAADVIVDDCKIGPPLDTILDPTIEVTDDVVVVSLTARQVGPAACLDTQPMAGGRPTALEIELPGTVGDRMLRDGSLFPGRDTLSPPDWYFGVGG